jgi:hypothetical protein
VGYVYVGRNLKIYGINMNRSFKGEEIDFNKQRFKMMRRKNIGNSRKVIIFVFYLNCWRRVNLGEGEWQDKLCSIKEGSVTRPIEAGL